MKALRNFFDKMYQKAGHKYHPVVESFDTIHFTPNLVTKSGSHIRDAVDLKRTIMFVIIAMIPCLLFGMWNVGHQHFLALGQFTEVGDGFWDKFFFGAIKVVPIIAVVYIVGLTVEFIFGIIKGHSLHEGFLATGLLIPLIMPVDTPLWMIAVATVFGVVIGKEVFGGTGMNVLNVALTSRAFLFFAHPTSMSGNEVWIAGLKDMKANGTLVDGVTGATPLGDLASFAQDTPAFENLDAFTAHTSLWDSFVGIIPGSIGETSALAALLGGLFLIITGIASWRVMLSFFLGGLAMAFIFNLAGGDGDYYMSLNPIHQLVLGGFAFGMVFMVTDPVTAAQTNTGKFIYGALAGLLAILIRVANPAYPEGVMLGILMANVFAPTIDHYVVQANIKKRLKRAAKSTAVA